MKASRIFSLLNRRFEDELADVCRRENVSLLPYSPIAGGVLTGKYNADPIPANARFSKYANSAGRRQQRMANRFLNDKTLGATAEFQKIAADLNVTATALAVAWSKQHDFVASTLVGANTVEQLEEILKARDLTLDKETLKRIDQVSQDIMYPMG